ncbi:hypothetical protein AKJ16_DCAP21801 [Drosera capensis]
MSERRWCEGRTHETLRTVLLSTTENEHKKEDTTHDSADFPTEFREEPSDQIDLSSFKGVLSRDDNENSRRRPGPVVVAIIVIVAELNGISVKMRDLALELDVVASTAKKRYDEVLDALVEDVSAKNTMKNAHFVIQ